MSTLRFVLPQKKTDGWPSVLGCSRSPPRTRASICYDVPEHVSLGCSLCQLSAQGTIACLATLPSDGFSPNPVLVTGGCGADSGGVLSFVHLRERSPLLSEVNFAKPVTACAAERLGSAQVAIGALSVHREHPSAQKQKRKTYLNPNRQGVHSQGRPCAVCKPSRTHQITLAPAMLSVLVFLQVGMPRAI